MRKLCIAIAISIACALSFEACSSSRMNAEKLETRAINTSHQRGAPELSKVNSLSLADFQPIGCQIERPAPNQIKVTLGKQPAIFMLSSEKLKQLSENHWLSFKRECDGGSALSLSLLFWSENNQTQRPDLTIAEGIFPGVPSRRAIPLKLLKEGRGTPKTPGSLISFAFGAGLHADEWSRFAIALTDYYGEENRTVILEDFQFTEEEPDYPVGDQVIVDEMGQWAKASFKEKFSNTRDMISYLKTEAALELPTRESATRSQYGGTKEKRFKATGYFRTHHDGKRWFLVDPDGYLFYSVGIDIVNYGIGGNVEGIRGLHAWLPSETDKKYADAWIDSEYIQDIRSATGFSSQKLFDFGVANLIKAFGEKWHKKWAKITSRRLIEWNVNTVGNWSDTLFCAQSKTPYVMALEGFPLTRKRIFRDFPDVFSTEYQEKSAQFAQQLTSFKKDPYLIGYFMNNEPGWAYVSEINLAEQVLEKEEEFASKTHLIQFLRDTYKSNIRAFNTAWKTNFSSFEQLHMPMRKASSLSEQADTDLQEFSRRMLEAYIRIPAEACKAIDPHHLNLGMRWASRALKQKWRFAGSQYLDVFSINNYSDDPSERLDVAADMSGNMPVLIGEFQHGSMEGGYPTYGVRWTKTEAERAIAYKYYAEKAASHPNSIGIHYFAYLDDPVLGRFDGQNFHQGFVTSAHRPYTDFVEGYKKANAGLYEVVLNQRKPMEKYPDGMVQFIPLSF